ncbi:MAG: metallophosphoesterase [Methanobrevibacter sp.]|nr:metallophosphoesterase [Methanobrevibacter sp.]
MANKIVTLENLERYHNEISQIIDSKQDAISDLNEYAKKSDIPQVDGLASEEYVNTKFDEVFQNVSNGKYLIASALTDKGVYASDDDTFQELSDKINQIIVAAPGTNLVGYVDDENDIYISLSGIANGTYTLKFEDANGVLSGFDTIGEVVIDDSSDSFRALLDCNVAPQQASKIGLYDSNGNSVGTIPLYNYKKRPSGKLYSFGIISDLHIQSEDTYDGHNDLHRAFNFFTEQGIDMTCCCGDIADTNSLQEYVNFKAIKDQYPNIDFYACPGNHDCSGINGYNKTYWNTYIGCEQTFEINRNGDHFLFIGMNAWDFKNGYTDKDLDWLETKLNEYRNERCFVFIHCPIPQYVGNYKEMYEPNNWLTGSNLYRVTEMVNHYVNSVWFSGHSHWKWHLQKWEENANIYRNNSAWNVHIPSCAIPGDAIDDVEIGRIIEGNEGGIIDVYENYIEIRGIDLKTGNYIPVAQYRLDTTIQPVIDKDVTATIKMTYSHSTASNEIGVIEFGQSYTNTFTVDEGYIIESITVKMEDKDISGEVVSNNTINIPNVTGDIEIIVTVKQLEYLFAGQLKASDFALYSTDNGQTVTQDGNDIVFNFPTTTSAKFTWVAGNAVGNKYSQSTHIAVLHYDGIEYSQELSDVAKCYVGFIDLSGDYYTTNEEVPLSWSNHTDPTKGVQFNMSSRFAANGGSAPLTIRLVNPHIRLRTPKKYRITQSLDHCSSSYISTTISEMITKQKITFTPDTGYVMESFKVTMNGVELPYSYVDGNSIVINTISGNINIEATAVEVVEFDGVNMIPLSVDHDGSIFNEVGYMTNKRVDYSSGEVIDAVATVPNSSVTGFIPFAPGDVLYFYRVPWNISKDVGEINILLYEEDKVTKVNNVNPSDFISRLGGSCPGIASDPKSCFIYFADEKSQMVAIAFNPNSTSSMVAKTKWIRITTTELLDEYSIISKNQPITNITHYNVRVAGENCSFTNGTSTITQFNPFTTKVVPNENCVLVGINVIMNGQDVTTWYVKDNTVNIPYVYGDVVITANVNKVATEDVEDIDITYSKNTRLSQSSGNQTAYDGAVATNRIDISRVPKPCYLDMTGVAWAANSAAVHNRIVYSMDLMCGLRSNGYTGTNGSTNADYNDALNISNIERKNDTNTDITITITDPGISTIAFSGYTGTDAAGDGFTGQGNMDDANIHIWYKPEESVSYDFSGNLLEGIPVEYNKRWSASSGTCIDSNGILVLKVPMSVALGKQFKLTGFSSSMTSVDSQPSTFYVQPDETSAGASILAMKPLWSNSNCVANGDGTYTVTVPNTDVTTAHQILFITLAVDNTKAISAADVANCKVEIL